MHSCLSQSKHSKEKFGGSIPEAHTPYFCILFLHAIYKCIPILAPGNPAYVFNFISSKNRHDLSCLSIFDKCALYFGCKIVLILGIHACYEMLFISITMLWFILGVLPQLPQTPTPMLPRIPSSSFLSPASPHLPSLPQSRLSPSTSILLSHYQSTSQSPRSFPNTSPLTSLFLPSPTLTLQPTIVMNHSASPFPSSLSWPVTIVNLSVLPTPSSVLLPNAEIPFVIAAGK